MLFGVGSLSRPKTQFEDLVHAMKQALDKIVECLNYIVEALN